MTTPALQWTAPAIAGLERYFAVRLAPEQLDGADPQELRPDLQAHFEEELTQAGVSVVTLEDLRLVLAKMGEVLPSTAVSSEVSIASPPPLLPRATPEALPVVPPSARPAALFRSPSWFLIFAVILPFATFLFEVVTRGGAGLFFDPMPDLIHHLLVLVVPFAGWTYWRSQKPDAAPWVVRWSPWLVGAGLASAGFYAVCFLPVMPVAVIGVIGFGLGLLPLAPFLSLLALWRARVLLRRSQGEGVRHPLRWGFRLTAGLILLLEMPGLLTRIGIHKASRAGADAEGWADVTRFLRRFGSEEALLKSCYPSRGSSMFGQASGKDPGAWLAGWMLLPNGAEESPWNASLSISRELHYRVTGVPFNEQPPPGMNEPIIPNGYNRGSRWQIDEDRGGTTVAGRIDGLSLAEGRMDWHCEQASGLTWGEWTLTFDNKTASPEEARCRIALPPGGFVSRVTLWVNGQPEEAAYSTVSKVRAAYQSVAVVQRRDPVLVTQPDAGSILVQAFPVPARGQLKTRITFTVPAGVDSKVWLPSIVERNFAFPAKAAHPLWVQANHGSLTLPAEVNPHAAEEDGAPTVTGLLPLAGFTGGGTSFRWTHQEKPLVFSEDPFAPEASRLVVRKAEPPAVFQPTAIAWVIDTSAPLKETADVISTAIAALSDPAKTAIFLPGDAPSEMQTLTDPANLKLACAGGRDNTPALAAAVEWVRGHPGASLIWIHGPQQVSDGARSSLDQLLERSNAPFTLMDLPIVPGQNRLGALFSATPRIRVVPVRHAGPDLAATLRAAYQQRGGTFTTLPAGTAPPGGAVETSDALARWFARSEAGRLAVSDPAAASAMAASHQIVSPWSGAVVLEKAADYRAHGLQQANATVAQQIPVVPEPSGVVLIVVSALPLLLRRQRARLHIS